MLNSPIKKRSQEYTEDLYKKDLHDPDNHDGVITHLESDILECEVKWALESITTNKASGCDGIPVELFQILKEDAVKVLHSIYQQTWKTQQWPQDWFSSVAQSCPTLCDSMDCSTPRFPIHHQLLEFTQTHVDNLISGFTAFSKTRLNIWNFTVSCTFEAWLGEF